MHSVHGPPTQQTAHASENLGVVFCGAGLASLGVGWRPLLHQLPAAPGKAHATMWRRVTLLCISTASESPALPAMYPHHRLTNCPTLAFSGQVRCLSYLNDKLELRDALGNNAIRTCHGLPPMMTRWPCLHGKLLVQNISCATLCFRDLQRQSPPQHRMILHQSCDFISFIAKIDETF